MADDARRRLGAPPMQGVLRIGIADEFATTKLSGVLGIFRTRHPGFEMRFLTGRNDYLFAAFEAGEVDIILGKCHSGRHKGELLWREPLAWIGQPWALEREAVPLVAYLRPSETRDVAEAALLAARRPWVVVAQFANLLGLLAAVEAGFGVTALGRNFVPAGFAEVPAEAGLPPLGTLDYVIDRRPDRAEPALDAFADLLRGVAQQLAPAR
jgi:DNA-binding transcriptional LysR family regulator